MFKEGDIVRHDYRDGHCLKLKVLEVYESVFRGEVVFETDERPVYGIGHISNGWTAAQFTLDGLHVPKEDKFHTALDKLESCLKQEML